jgi:hypothetical protein
MVCLGFAMTPADYPIQPIELAKAVEERALESLFFHRTVIFRYRARLPFQCSAACPESTVRRTIHAWH